VATVDEKSEDDVRPASIIGVSSPASDVTPGVPLRLGFSLIQALKRAELVDVKHQGQNINVRCISTEILSKCSGD
jgi:hypothetical protein